jgi:ATP:ADP antiporter, AAA family
MLLYLCYRDTKDTLIVTNCGAEAIAFLKVYGVVPAATLFMLWYNWLSNHVSSRALFHLVSACKQQRQIHHML